MDGAERIGVRTDGGDGRATGELRAEIARLAAALMAIEARAAEPRAGDGRDGLAGALAEAEASRAECARLRASNERLREVCAALREGTSDPDAAIDAELEAIAAQRAAERAELDRLIRALGVMAEEAA